MKFRGRMTDLPYIRKFYSVLDTMAKLSKVCVMRLTADKVYFILTDSGGLRVVGSGGPSVWCELSQSAFFQEYNMEGVTAEAPEIYLELEPDRLAKTLNALKSSNLTRALKIKLTRKRGSPCLSFEIELASSSSASVTTNATTSIGGGGPTSSSRVCVHDIPVNLIPRRLWSDYREPDMQAFDISLYLPELRQIRHLAEKYKNLGSHLTIQANRLGSLKLSLDTDQVKVVTHFKNLQIPHYDDTVAASRMSGSRVATAGDFDEAGGEDEEAFSSVRVDLKRFSLFLSAEQLGPKRVVANFSSGKMLHLFMIHDDIWIQYFIPAVLE